MSSSADTISKSCATLDSRRELFGGRCRESAMFHLAFWKRGLYHFSCPVPPIDAHILLVSDSGLIPLRIESISQRDDVTYGALFGREVLSIGRVRGGLANHGDLATYYCILFAASLKTCVCPLLHRQIRIQGQINTSQRHSRNSRTYITI